jgi:17beta-estradiol 17-dehydrogenase / very-long-chain 3-oxoacyl-CoA reductase
MKFFNNLSILNSLSKRAKDNLHSKYFEKNNWAIVTGSTSGIGEEFSNFLSENNFNLILFGRNQDKLNDIKINLEKINQHSLIKIYKFDFSEDSFYSKENFDYLRSEFSGKNLKILINNVGETTFGGDFHKFSIIHNKKFINTNINSHMFMTQLFMQLQTESKSETRNAIINISSYFGTRPVPGLSLYSSCKSFLTNFSNCLKYESPNTDVLCLTPLFVKTKMVKKVNSKLLRYFLISPEEVVHSAFVRINTSRSKSYGHWKHILLAGILNSIPNQIFEKITHEYYSSQYSLLYARRHNLKTNKDNLKL